MIVKSISREQRKKAATERATMRKRGGEPQLKRITARKQAAHVMATSAYFMRPTKAGEKALGIDGHRVHRTTEYLVRDKPDASAGERLLHAAHQNFRSATLAEQQAEMIALMSVEPGKDDALEHLVLSPGPGIVPTRDQMDDVPKRLLNLLGAGEHQAFVVWHGDTHHIHAHIGISRIDPVTGTRNLAATFSRNGQCEILDVVRGRPTPLSTAALLNGVMAVDEEALVHRRPIDTGVAANLALINAVASWVIHVRRSTPGRGNAALQRRVLGQLVDALHEGPAPALVIAAMTCPVQ